MEEWLEGRTSGNSPLRLTGHRLSGAAAKKGITSIWAGAEMQKPPTSNGGCRPEEKSCEYWSFFIKLLSSVSANLSIC